MKVEIPSALLDCPDLPSPGDITMQSGVADYVVRLKVMAEACKGDVDAIREIMKD